MNKRRFFELHWTAEVKGKQIVEAFDEEDAESQFDGIIHEDGMPDEPMYASFEEAIEIKKPKDWK